MKGSSSGGAQRLRQNFNRIRPERSLVQSKLNMGDKTFIELSIEDYIIKETYDYTMILDENYYNPYHEWLEVDGTKRNRY